MEKLPSDILPISLPFPLLLVMVFLGVCLYQYRLFSGERGRETEATITEVLAQNKRHQLLNIYFQDETGKEITTKINFKGKHAYQVGEKISIRYSKINILRAVPSSMMTFWILAIVALSLLAISGATAIYLCVTQPQIINDLCDYFHAHGIDTIFRIFFARRA